MYSWLLLKAGGLIIGGAVIGIITGGVIGMGGYIGGGVDMAMPGCLIIGGGISYPIGGSLDLQQQ